MLAFALFLFLTATTAAPAGPLGGPAPAQGAAEQAWILRADGLIQPDGSLLPDGAVLLRGDKILAIGSEVPAPAKAGQLRLQGVLAPGFIDAFAQVGVRGGLYEDARLQTPGLRCADAVDFDHPDWRKLLEQGVTAVHLVPDPARPWWERDAQNVIAGQAAVLRSGGERAQRLLLDSSRQTFALLGDPSGGPTTGAPTSLAGAVEALGQALAAGQAGVSAAPAVLAFVDGDRAVTAMRALAAQHGEFPCAWVAWGDLGSYGGALAGELVGVPVLGPGGGSERWFETMRRLHAAGTRVAFGSYHRLSWATEPNALRATAMAYSRATGDAAAALAAVTANAAQLCGAGRTLGVLAPGARADLVLWSAHPLDAAARVKAVMIAGRTVWSAEPAQP